MTQFAGGTQAATQSPQPGQLSVAHGLHTEPCEHAKEPASHSSRQAPVDCWQTNSGALPLCRQSEDSLGEADDVDDDGVDEDVLDASPPAPSGSSITAFPPHAATSAAVTVTLR